VRTLLKQVQGWLNDQVRRTVEAGREGEKEKSREFRPDLGARKRGEKAREGQKLEPQRHMVDRTEDRKEEFLLRPDGNDGDRCGQRNWASREEAREID